MPPGASDLEPLLEALRSMHGDVRTLQGDVRVVLERNAADREWSKEQRKATLELRDAIAELSASVKAQSALAERAGSRRLPTWLLLVAVAVILAAVVGGPEAVKALLGLAHG